MKEGEQLIDAHQLASGEPGLLVGALNHLAEESLKQVLSVIPEVLQEEARRLQEAP